MWRDWRSWEEQFWWRAGDKNLIEVSSRENRRGIENVEYTHFFKEFCYKGKEKMGWPEEEVESKKGCFCLFSRWAKILSKCWLRRLQWRGETWGCRREGRISAVMSLRTQVRKWRGWLRAGATHPSQREEEDFWACKSGASVEEVRGGYWLLCSALC